MIVEEPLRSTSAFVRRPGTMANGKPFSTEVIEAVWCKALPVALNGVFRKDACGAIMSRMQYGQPDSFGWVIDHIKPVASGGTDDLDNLQPLHWENNLHKGDDYPHWACKRRI